MPLIVATCGAFQACNVHPKSCTWTEYEFAYKPGSPTRPPPWVAPHMPRLDWQMWFLAFESDWAQVCRVLFCHFSTLTF